MRPTLYRIIALFLAFAVSACLGKGSQSMISVTDQGTDGSSAGTVVTASSESFSSEMSSQSAAFEVMGSDSFEIEAQAEIVDMEAQSDAIQTENLQ